MGATTCHMPPTTSLLVSLALLLACCSASAAASECKIAELEAGAWQASDKVPAGPAPELAPLVVSLLRPQWESECTIIPEKAEVEVVADGACQSKVSAEG